MRKERGIDEEVERVKLEKVLCETVEIEQHRFKFDVPG